MASPLHGRLKRQGALWIRPPTPTEKLFPKLNPSDVYKRPIVCMSVGLCCIILPRPIARAVSKQSAACTTTQACDNILHAELF